MPAGDYDFVIGSIHNIRGYEDFFFLDYSKIERSFIDALLETYWQEELEVIRWGKFDSLGHLTYPCGISRATTVSRWILSRHSDAIDTIFRALRDSGKPWR